MRCVRLKAARARLCFIHNRKKDHPYQSADMSIPSVTAGDVERYHYHHGVNLGSIFVLDKTLTPSIFPDNYSDYSELSALIATETLLGREATRLKWHQHWDSIADSELEYLVQQHVNSVRLPIGYFTLGSTFCEGTAMAPWADVYEPAWAAVRRLIVRLHARGISTLLDLHAAPGGANDSPSSGADNGSAELWRSQWFRRLLRECVVFLAKEARALPGISGIQVCNDAQPGAPGIWNLYRDVFRSVAEINPAIPLYISDAGDTERALKFAQEQNDVFTSGARMRPPVIVETHLSWDQTQKQRQLSSKQVIKEELPNFLTEFHNRRGSLSTRGVMAIVVGEWNCSLDWGESSETDRELLRQRFGLMQETICRVRTGGHFFWNFRTEKSQDAERDFRKMSDAGAIATPEWLRITRAQVEESISAASERNEWLKRQGLRAYLTQARKKLPPEKIEQRRYEQGWDVGFEDVVAFFRHRSTQNHAGADMIGQLDLWIRKRILDTGNTGSGAREFEAGLRGAVTAFEKYAFFV